MKVFLRLLFLSLFSFAHADETPGIQCMVPSSLASTNGICTSIVNNCVSTITGDYVDGALDMHIAGTEPLLIQRSYSSGNHSQSFLQAYAWQLHNPSYCYAAYKDEDTFTQYTTGANLECYVKNSAGLTKFDKYLTFQREPPFFELDLKMQKGETNCSGGEISARTNPKQNRLIIFLEPKKPKDPATLSTCLFITGANSVQKSKRFGSNYLILESETKPNGNQILCEYDEATAKLKKITSKDRAGEVCGWADFSWDYNHNNPLQVKSSDGNEVKYFFEGFSRKIKRKDKQTETHNLYYIKKISNKFRPEISYSHLEKIRAKYKAPSFCISEKKLLNHVTSKDSYSILKIEYYRNDDNTLINLDPVGKLESSDARVNRVRALKQPVGSDSTLHTTHQFIYNFTFDKKRTGWEVLDGSTDVYDAYLCKTTYHYNKDHRLDWIEKYNGRKKNAYSLYSKEEYVWGVGQDEGNLIEKKFKDKKGNTLISHQFKYDPKGNITTSIISGNITKIGTSDSYQHEYTYSNDNYNLLLTETEQNGKKIEYSYLPNSDLIVSQFVSDKNQNKILQRRFFEYDNAGNIIKKIIDDGSSSDINSTVGASERHITYITPKSTLPAKGLPEKQYEYYLDLKTGIEKLLHGVQNIYSDEGRLIEQKHYDANKNYCYSLKWEYDNHGNVTLETNALGQTIARTYDVNDNLKEEKGPLPNCCTKHTYDYMHRKTKSNSLQNDKSMSSLDYTYDFRNQCTKTTDHQGNITENSYDDFGRITQTLGTEVIDEHGNKVRPKTSFEYDEFGNVITMIDPKGNITKTTYNIHKKPLTVTYPDGTSESSEYNLDGTLKKFTAKNGLETRYTYDCLGRLLTKEEWSSENTMLSREVSEYNGFHLASSTDASGTTTFFTYDGAGRPSSIVQGDVTTTFEYDSLGRVCKKIEWTGPSENDVIVKVSLYDLLNRVVEERVEDALGTILNKINYSYDEAGNKTSVIIDTGKEIAYALTSYDPLKRPLEIVDALGNKTHYTYNDRFIDRFGKTVSQTVVTDPLGISTISTLDSLKRLASVEQKNSLGITLAKKEMFYDTAGNLVKTVESDISEAKESEIVTLWEYNSMNQLLSQIEAYGTNLQKHTLNSYNKFGQLESITKADGVLILHDYDAKGRLAKFEASNHSFFYTYEFNNHNQIVKVTDTIAGTTTLRDYDQNHRIISETLSNGLKMNYGYDRLGRLIDITLPDTTGVHYTYQANLLKEVSRTNSNDEKLYSHQYDSFDQRGLPTHSTLISKAGELSTNYDIMGRITEIKSLAWSETVPKGGYDAVGSLLNVDRHDPKNETKNSFSYDDLKQIKSEEGSVSHHYASDSLFNRTHKDGCEYELNTLNQILHEQDNSYSYDLNGNLIEKYEENSNYLITKYEYDALGRLTAVIGECIKSEYRYDSFNRRISKTVTRKRIDGIWYKTVDHRYLFQDQNEIGIVDAENKIIALRVIGLSKGAEIGGAVALELNDKLYAPIHDLSGNVVCILDSETGKVAEFYRYSAFGEEKIYDATGEEISISAINNPWRFSSKQVDETGLIYFGRRYYDSRLGRWITPDPLGFQAGPNLYAYVSNSPLTHFDLFGLFEEEFASLGSDALNPWNNFAIGDLLKFCGRHCLPDFQGRSNVEATGNWFQNYDYSYNKDYYDTTYDTYTAKGKRTPYQDVIYLSNGMNTTPEYFHKNVNNFSIQIGGYETHGFYSPTRGGFSDFFNAGLWLITGSNYFQRGSVEALKSSIYKEFAELGPKGMYFATPHSRGTETYYQALKELPKSLTDRMVILTFGAAQPIPPNFAGYVRNFVTTSDPLYLCNLFDCGSCANTATLGAKKMIEHSFDPTYINIAIDECKKFIERKDHYAKFK